MTLFIHRNAGGRCPCGAANAACGPPSDVVPVDQLIEEVPAVSGPLRKYRVTRGGVETVMKLNDADAQRLGVSVDQAVDAVPTIQPVELASAEADSEADDGPADDDTGAGADGDDGASADGGQEAAAVQSTADTSDDGQTPAAADSPQETTTPAPVKKTAAAKKTAAKRQPAAANKARTGSATKAVDGGS